MEPLLMSDYEGSRAELRKAVVLVATAEGRVETMQRLANLEHAARAWRRVLDVDPRVATLIEGQRDRELERAA